MEWVYGVWRAAWFARCVRSQAVGIAASRRVGLVVSRRGARDETGPVARASGDVHLRG